MQTEDPVPSEDLGAVRGAETAPALKQPHLLVTV